ncbi:MAG: hypothetical protein JO263_07785, partial [Candidatus Eremiobacteraeota bacterium]|nr:hypothetical protein [Candidatus Eremiobacteraeota bacterium]
MLYSRLALGVFGTALLLTACNGSAAIPSPPAAATLDASHFAQPFGFAPRAKGKIKHVIIIVQENRSLNNLFMGFPGAETTKYGYDSQDKEVPLKPIALETKWDLAHNAEGVLKACNGVGSIPGTECRMNGFDKEQVVLC